MTEDYCLTLWSVVQLVKYSLMIVEQEKHGYHGSTIISDQETPMNKGKHTHTLLYVYVDLCNDVYDGELPMTPHEWEDNLTQKEQIATNLDYCVILELVLQCQLQ